MLRARRRHSGVADQPTAPSGRHGQTRTTAGFARDSPKASYIASSTPEQTAQGIAAVVQTIREVSPNTKVLLLGVLPRGTYASDPYRASVAAVNQQIGNLGNAPGVTYHNFGNQLLNSDGTFPNWLSPDGLHLTPAGYNVWLNSMLPVLQNMLAS